MKKRLQSSIRKVRIKKGELGAIKDDMIQAENMLEKSLKDKRKAEELSKKAEKLKEDIEKYEERDALISTIKGLEEEAGNLKEEDRKLKDSEKKLKEKIEDLDSTIKALKDCGTERIKIQNEGKELAALRLELEDMKSHAIPNYEKAEKTLRKKQNAFQKEQKKYNDALTERKHYENILDNCRAGMLAQGLEEGSKCPVCGSTHHPCPAVLLEETVSEDEFKELQEKEESAKETKDGALVEVEKAKTAMESETEQLRNRIFSCIENVHSSVALPEVSFMEELFHLIPVMLDDVEKQLLENTKKESQLTKDCKVYDKAVKDFDKARGEESDFIEHRKKDYNAKKEKNQTLLTEKRTALKEYEKLEFADFETARKEQKKAEKVAKKILDTIENAVAAKQEADTKKTRIESALNTLEETLKSQRKKADESRENFEKILQIKKFTSKEEFLEFLTDEDEIEEKEKQINAYRQMVKTNSELTKTGKGGCQGKNRS